MEGAEIKFDVPWGHVAAKAFGSPQDPYVLMVHGLLDNAGSFDRLRSLLPQNFYYVCVDLPGHGYSSPFPPGLPLQFFDYVHAIRLVIKALDCESCIGVGHSFGAHLLTYYSFFYPEKIKKLVLLDGIGPFTLEDSDLWQHLKDIYDLESYDYDAGHLYTKDEVLYGLKFLRHNTLNSEAAEALFERSVTKVGDLYKYNRDPRLRRKAIPWLNLEQHAQLFMKLTRPVLIILASDSHKMTRTIAEHMVARINDPKMFLIKSVTGNHDVHNNFPERVAPHVRWYLTADTGSPVSKL